MSAPSPVKTSGNLPALHSMVFPKSVSVTELLKAGKLVKPPATNITALDLESFDVAEMKWVKSGSLTLEIEERRFAHGHLEMHFVLLPSTKMLHKPHGW